MPDDMEVRCSLSEGYVAIRDLYKAKQEINYIASQTNQILEFLDNKIQDIV